MYGLLFSASVLLFGLTVTLGKWIWDYYRDPKGLRRFPTFSTSSGITNIPFMLASHAGEFRSKDVYMQHKQGKPVIRIGPDSLSFSDVRAIKDIYSHSTRCIKDGNYEVQAGTHYHLADVIDKKDHARKRKVLSSAYALKNLEEWEFKVADKVERIIKQFDKRCCESGKMEPVLNYREWANYFTLDAISDIGLSNMLGFIDNASDRTYGQRNDGTIYETNLREGLYANSRANSVWSYTYDFYKPARSLSKLIPLYNRLWKLDEGWSGIPIYQTARRSERYQAGENLSDFFQALMEDKNGANHNLEFGEIAAEISIMLNAGSTTTAIAITNAMYHLLKNPKCMQRLQQEVDETLDDDEEVAPYEKVKYLPYLRACLDEALRITPPTSQGLTRETPAEGMDVAGEYIPGGTSVAVSAYIAHRDPVVFPEPEQYIPDRWLGEAGKELGPYFLAFSAGARGCIGRNIAYLEQTVLLASMLHRYKFELAQPGFEPVYHEWMNTHPDRLPVKIWRRSAMSTNLTQSVDTSDQSSKDINKATFDLGDDCY